MDVSGQIYNPAALSLEGKPRYPLKRGLAGPMVGGLGALVKEEHWHLQELNRD